MNFFHIFHGKSKNKKLISLSMFFFFFLNTFRESSKIFYITTKYEKIFLTKYETNVKMVRIVVNSAQHSLNGLLREAHVKHAFRQL